MTDKPAPLSTLPAAPSQIVLAAPPLDPVVKDDPVPHKVETVEEEPYTIKCICNFSGDDGSTIYCDTCDTWQHIECFYPNNREEVIREDFAHSCADCKPRMLNRQRAVERALQLKKPAALGPDSLDKKTRRPPSKSSHKKKPKPADAHANGYHSAQENGKHDSPGDNFPPSKKAKSSHRPSQSLGSAPTKRSPSYGNSRPNAAGPPSPANTPPDLPQNFLIHHYSENFYSLYTAKEVPDTHNNPFASLAIPTALARWLREPDAMKQETGRTHSEVFQDGPPSAGDQRPKLNVEDTTRTVNEDTTLRWRFIKSTAPIEKDVPLIELNGEIGFQKDYSAEPDNHWADLSSPLPFVFFHPFLPLYIDTRKEGSIARYVRRSCKPNAQLDTYLSGGSEYHFWLVSDRHIATNEQITLPWDFRLEKSIGAGWLHLLGLSDDDASGQDEPDLDHTEYLAISTWIDRILSEYGGCACDLDNNCAFARFHRHYLFGRHQARLSSKRKHRKSRNHTVSPTSTGHATNSRAVSEGHADETMDDTVSQSGSTRSKPPSRDQTPIRQGSLDRPGILTEPTDRDKRKVAMVEDSFRRMEQQQPLKKKKRVSDGTTASNSSRPTGRNGSVAMFGNYVDAGTSRSKSGSPSSAQSPTFSNVFKPSLSRPESLADTRSRHTSTGPRSSYCDAGMQTDPVQGEWFSEPMESPRPRKKIISLSRRLFNSKHRSRLNSEHRGTPPCVSQSPTVTTMEMQSPTMINKMIPTIGNEAPQMMPRSTDVQMHDAPPAPYPSADNASDATTAKMKTPDLRVLMPPTPTFDNSGLLADSIVTTPQSMAGSVPPSPFGTGILSNPFGPPAANGIMLQPSPVKKKLSLSDYKSRMNKTAGKVAGGNAILKASLLSPEETKVDITMDGQPPDKTEEGVPQPNTAPTTNGV